MLSYFVSEKVRGSNHWPSSDFPQDASELIECRVGLYLLPLTFSDRHENMAKREREMREHALIFSAGRPHTRQLLVHTTGETDGEVLAGNEHTVRVVVNLQESPLLTFRFKSPAEVNQASHGVLKLV